MDLKKRFVGGLVGLVLGAHVLSMSGCASMKIHTFGGTKTPNYAQIKKKGLEKITNPEDWIFWYTLNLSNDVIVGTNLYQYMHRCQEGI